MRRRSGRERRAGLALVLLAAGLCGAGACALPGYEVTSGTGGAGAGAGGSTNTNGGGGTTSVSQGGSGASTSTSAGGGGGTGAAGGAGGGGAGGGCSDCGPAVAWFHAYGSPLEDHALGVAVTPANDRVLMAGSFGASLTFGNFAPVHGGNDDGFVVRCNAGDGVVDGGMAWAGSTAAAGNQQVRAVVPTAAGGVVVAGSFTEKVVLVNPGTSFPSLGLSDGFVAEYDAAGTLLWSVQLGGTGDQIVNAMVVDFTGAVIVAGTQTGQTTVGPSLKTDSFGAEDAFVVKIGAGTPQWVRSFGSPSKDAVTGLAVDASANITVIGLDQNTMDVGDGNTIVNMSGTNDMFAIHLDAGGVSLWSKGFGGLGQQIPRAVVVDDMAGIYLAGDFDTTLALDQTYTDAGGARDLFVAKLDPANGVPTWSTTLADAGTQSPLALAWSSGAGLVLGGTFTGTLNFGAAPIVAVKTDAFLIGFDGATNAYAWHKVFSGPGAQAVTALAFDGLGALHVVGDYADSVTFDTHQARSSGLTDLFMLKLEP